MIRPLGIVIAALFALPFAPAAPVPTHLFPKDAPLVIPTKVGTTWVYECDGREKTLAITSAEGKNGAVHVTTEWIARDGTRFPHMVVTVSEQGVFLVAEQGHTYHAPWCILKLPHRRGQEWETRVGKGGDAPQIGKMMSGPWEQVKVPAGEFTAARVEWRYPIGEKNVPPTVTYWYAGGIGLVRLGNSMKLKSFTPARGK
jgi:hypothetical protein